jgi:predicted  nucleic acid-binding Zn-ribbon protein
MSDLKHRTADELREEIASVSRYRARLEREWKDLEERIVQMQDEVKVLRSKHHNFGQKEAWARIYLAQKS